MLSVRGVLFVAYVAGRVVAVNADGVHLFETDTGTLVATFTGVYSSCEYVMCDRWVPLQTADAHLLVLDCVAVRLVDVGPTILVRSVTGDCLAYAAGDDILVARLNAGPDSATGVRELRRVPLGLWLGLCDGGRSFVAHNNDENTIELCDVATGARIRQFAAPVGRQIVDLQVLAEAGFMSALMDNDSYVAYAVSGASVSAPFAYGCVLVHRGRACGQVGGIGALPCVDIVTGARLPYASVSNPVLDTSGALMGHDGDALFVRTTPDGADRALSVAESRVLRFRYGIAVVCRTDDENVLCTDVRMMRFDMGPGEAEHAL